MQLISTKQYYEPSTGYQIRPLLIDRTESATETWGIQKKIAFVPVNIIYPIRESGEELSVFLKPIKDIELLESIYTFSTSNDVKRFLLSHDFLIDALFEAYRQIKSLFGENVVEVSLEYDRDPEEDFEGLFVVVKTNLSPEESLDLLDKFDEKWFLDNVSGEIGSIFTVTVRPV